jgi:hypothetical protein
MPEIIGICFSSAAVAFALLFWIVVRRQNSESFDPFEWLESFTPAAYRPMQRLLSRRDAVFLASQPGFEPAMAGHLRWQRIAIFQQYLRAMIRDFHRLLTVARILMVFEATDQSAMASSLFAARLRFYRSVLAVEGGVLLYALGLDTVGLQTVDTRGLLASVARLHAVAGGLMPALE